MADRRVPTLRRRDPMAVNPRQIMKNLLPMTGRGTRAGPTIFRDAGQLGLVGAVGIVLSAALKTRKLFILRNARNAKNAENAEVGYTAGTRTPDGFRGGRFS
jgi:hypothetical protein